MNFTSRYFRGINHRIGGIVGLVVLQALLFSCALPTTRNQTRGTWMPAFDLDGWVGSSGLVVIGQLDENGSVQIHEVLSGNADRSIPARIIRGEYIAKKIQGDLALKGPVDVVGFLFPSRDATGQWEASLGSIVAFLGDNVCMYDRVGFEFSELMFPGEGSFVQGPFINRPDFVQKIRDAIFAAKERDRILAMPRSAQRASALVAFALKHDDQPEDALPKKSAAAGRRYHLEKIAAGLRPIAAEEQAEILSALGRVASKQERATLLYLAGRIPVSALALDAVAAYLTQKHPPEVRRAAITALARIDGVRAADRLAPYLMADEPELTTVLASLESNIRPLSDRLLSLKVADALVRLATAVRAPNQLQGQDHLRNERTAMLGLLAAYGHPHFVPILYDWALAKDQPSSDYALSLLQALAGQKARRDQTAEWRTWRDKTRTLFETDYDLKKPAGRAAWMAAWNKADKTTQTMLLNLWRYESEITGIDEPALFEAAKEDASARLILAELWARKTLSPAIRKAIVEKFVQFELKEPADYLGWDKYPNHRSASLLKYNSFPFPEEVEVQFGAGLAIGDNDWSLVERVASERLTSISLTTGYGANVSGDYPGATAVYGYAVMREVDPQDGNKVLWTVRWKVGPLQLRNPRQ